MNPNETNPSATDAEANERANALLDAQKPLLQLGTHFKSLMVLLVLSSVLLFIMLTFERILFSAL